MEISERLLTPGEVALMFRVDPKTVTRWASAGRIGSIRTPGGHRRFRESEGTGFAPTLTPRFAALAANPGRRVVPGSIDPNLISSTLGRSHRAVCAYSEE